VIGFRIIKMRRLVMRLILLGFTLAVAVLTPFIVQAMEKPIIYFSFDNIKGDTVPDLSGNGNDGTMENNPKIVNGQFGKGLEFESSRVKVKASDTLTPDLFKEGMFTLVIWINAKRTGNAWQQIFRAGPAPNDTLFINSNGRLSWRGWVGAAWAGGMCETAPGVVEANKWTHATVVSDKKHFRIYVNGELLKESSFQETRGNNGEYVIGGYAGGESYSGAVDEFAVFPAPLQQEDIKLIMEKGVMASTAVSPSDRLAVTWGEIKKP